MAECMQRQINLNPHVLNVCAAGLTGPKGRVGRPGNNGKNGDNGVCVYGKMVNGTIAKELIIPPSIACEYILVPL